MEHYLVKPECIVYYWSGLKEHAFQKTNLDTKY